MSMIRAGLVTLLLVLALGCGEDDSASNDPSTTTESTTTSTPSTTETSAPTTTEVAWPYDVDDYVAEITAAGGGMGGDITDDESECVSRGMVTGLTVERLADAEVTPEELVGMDDMFDLVTYREERAITVDALVDCLDLLELAIRGGGLGPDDARCVLQEVEESWLAEVLLGTTEGEVEPTPESDAALAAIEAACPGLLAEL